MEGSRVAAVEVDRVAAVALIDSGSIAHPMARERERERER